jgi:hypothetical protein|eukprot:COSAG01_NODE_1417_length_10376_cov_8.765009_8_plen_79_part_00
MIMLVHASIRDDERWKLEGRAETSHISMLQQQRRQRQQQQQQCPTAESSEMICRSLPPSELEQRGSVPKAVVASYLTQ